MRKKRCYKALKNDQSRFIEEAFQELEKRRDFGEDPQGITHIHGGKIEVNIASSETYFHVFMVL